MNFMPKFLVKDYRKLKWISDAHEVEVGAESEKYPKFHMRQSSFCVNLKKKTNKQLSGTLMEQQKKNVYDTPMAPWHVELKC